SRPVSVGVRLVERALALVTDRIVTISPRQRDDLVRRLAVAPDARTVTIPLGLDLDPLLALPASTPARRTLGDLRFEPDDLVIGYVGRFVAIKDLPTLVEAFAIARRELPRARLLLAGDGPGRAELAARIDALNVAGAVSLLGWTDDLAALYSAIDICALASINEGTPVAAIEAMAAGKAVVATAVGGVPDLIADARTGVLV